jgi:hypothetical protein
MDCDEDDSELMDSKEPGKANKKMMGRSYVISDNGMYERIIRKRKRKSGD